MQVHGGARFHIDARHGQILQMNADRHTGLPDTTRRDALRFAACAQQRAQFIDDRKHLMIAIHALTIVRPLLHFDDLAVFLEDPVGEPDQQWRTRDRAPRECPAS